MSSTNAYFKIFKPILEQGEDFPPTGEDGTMGIDPSAEADAMSNTLEPGTDPGELSTDASGEVAAAIARNNKDMQNTLTSWISQMSEFSEFLNGLDTNSIQGKLKTAVPDTVFDKIRSSEMKKISRVAMEVAGLTEILKGYLAGSDDPKYKYV